MNGSGDRDQHLSRLGPLINELIDHDIVCRTPSGTFELRDDVQAYLEEVSEKRARTVAQVYIGRSCSACGVMAPTRLAGDKRVCDPCRKALGASAESLPDSQSLELDRHRTRSRWIRPAS
jgi:hypothetical protein